MLWYISAQGYRGFEALLIVEDDNDDDAASDSDERHTPSQTIQLPVFYLLSYSHHLTSAQPDAFNSWPRLPSTVRSLTLVPLSPPPTTGSPMRPNPRAALLLVASCALVSSVAALPKITRTGRYLYSDDGSRFLIKGIAYQTQGPSLLLLAPFVPPHHLSRYCFDRRQ